MPFAGTMHLNHSRSKVKTAFHWAEIRHALQQKGKPIGPNDLVIAATVRAAGFTLVTRNAAEFRRVPALAMEVW